MTAVMESALSPEAVVPRSEQVAHEIYQRAEPLWADPDERRMFYEGMEVVRTELREGESQGGHPVHYKDEREQPKGSYKGRGAKCAVMRTPEDAVIVTYSTGNHGTSVGEAAAIRGQRAVVEATASISSTKRGLIEGTGAELHADHRTFTDARDAAHARAKSEGGIVIGPFNHPDVLAGQCSVGEEMVEDIIAHGLAQETVHIVVSVAGGGHISGIAVPIWHAKQNGRLGPNVRVIGVQPEGSDTLGRAVAKVQNNEEPRRLYKDGETQDTLCDALVITEESINPQTLAIAADTAFVSRFATIDRIAIARSVVELEAELSGTIETAAALPRAYVNEYAARFPVSEGNNPVHFILPISGGNKSPETATECERIIAEDNAARDRTDAERPVVEGAGEIALQGTTFNDLSAAHLDPKYRQDPVVEAIKFGARRRAAAGQAAGSSVCRGSVIAGGVSFR